MITRTQRTLVVAAAVAAIVTAANASDGAYFSQSWGWVALAFLVPSTVLLILDRVSVPGRLRIAFASLIGALGVWVALSTIWSISAPASAREVERLLVYVAVAVAVALVLRRGDGPAVAAGAFVGIEPRRALRARDAAVPGSIRDVDDVFNATGWRSRSGTGTRSGWWPRSARVLAVGLVAHARRGRTRRGWRRLRSRSSSSRCTCRSREAPGSRCSSGWRRRWRSIRAASRCSGRSSRSRRPRSRRGVRIAARCADDRRRACLGSRERRGIALAGVWPGSSSVRRSLACGRRTGCAPRQRVAPRDAAAVDRAPGSSAVALVAVAVAAGGPSPCRGPRALRGRARRGPDLNDRLFSISGNGRGETLRVAWDPGPIVPSPEPARARSRWSGTRAGRASQVVRDAHSLYLETFTELGDRRTGTARRGARSCRLVAASARDGRASWLRRSARFSPGLAASALDWHWEMVGLTTTALLAGSVGLVSAERRSRGTLHDGTPCGARRGHGDPQRARGLEPRREPGALRGARSLARKEWSEARDHARRAQALSHLVDGAGHRARRRAAGLGDREGALRAYRDAVDADPRDWIAWLRIAQVARGAESDAAYDRVRELNPR